jgi:site-specific DNA-methyltransferase (adenine-specific)
MINYTLHPNIILCGDCEEVLEVFPNNCIDLIITSPPYTNQRKDTYGGTAPEKYIDWFLPKSKEFLRVLKPTGTFILNIKEKVSNGERNTYVIELILALRKQGWLWTEEYIWYKKTTTPGKWPNRFRDVWERCLQFNKSRQFKMYQDNVMITPSVATIERAGRLTEIDKIRYTSDTGSGYGRNIEKCCDRKMVYPSNVLHLASESNNRGHPAAFPVSLPEWFIKLFTKENDIVMDPFMGSGSSMIAAKRNNRDYVGIEIKPEYCKLGEQRIKEGK